MRGWQMNEYPQLQPLSLRDEAQPGYEKIVWKPNWRCFCCHDTGLVQYSLVKKVINNYIPDRHKPIECNATHCNIRLGETLYETETLDRRFSADLCVAKHAMQSIASRRRRRSGLTPCPQAYRLDLDERQMWQEWSQERDRKRMLRLESIDNSEITHNLRVRSRTTTEQLEVNRRHQNIRNNY